MEKNYPKHLDFPLSEETRYEIEQQLLREKIIYNTKEELYCTARYRDFFDIYDEETIHAFIDGYAKKKAFYVLHGRQILKEEEASQLYFRNIAENFIWEIQQKKLFDLQCLWRAEKMVLPGVEVTKDFSYLEATIKNCSLIDSVTREELQLYIDFIFSEDYSAEDHNHSWQHYDTIKNNQVPAWYNYYDEQIHEGTLLHLPDIRGEKEFFYFEVMHQIKSEKEAEDANENPEIKPPLIFNYKTLEFFITTFEEKSLINNFYAAEKFHPDLKNNLQLDEALHLLRSSDEKIAVNENSNWKHAVIDAARHFKTRKIAEALLQVYHEYTLRSETGLPYYDETDAMRQQLILRKVNQYKKQILEARALNGEPADFNY